MRYALRLAEQGLGLVEPNPPVGAVLVDDELRLIAAGFHERFGGPHAEIHAIAAAGDAARGATLYVTLEPCCHHGKTPPCTDAVLAAGIREVVVAVADRAPHVAGRGLEQLRRAGVVVRTGLLAADAERLLAPFFRLMLAKRPWVHAKWAMTLDGRVASATGHSQWISSPESRARVHQLRGRMDGILVGVGTAIVDNPELTARPPGPRVPRRIVLDSELRLPTTRRLFETIAAGPVQVIHGPQAAADRRQSLTSAGAELIEVPMQQGQLDWLAVLGALGQQQVTHLLVEGGAKVLGSLFDAGLVDEVHVFIAPKLVGGPGRFVPNLGHGLAEIPQRSSLIWQVSETIGEDLYVHGVLTNGESV